MERAEFKKWLEELAKREKVKMRIRFIQDDYRAEARKDGTIIIPEGYFSSYTTRERRAVGAHELAHLKYRHKEKADKHLDKAATFVFGLFMLIVLSLIILNLLKMPIYGLFLNVIVIVFVVIAANKSIHGVRQYFRTHRMCELEADTYAAKKICRSAIISFLRKSRKVKEKWRRKSLRWRIIIWGRKHWPTHPSIDERIRYLEKFKASRKSGD